MALNANEQRVPINAESMCNPVNCENFSYFKLAIMKNFLYSDRENFIKSIQMHHQSLKNTTESKPSLAKLAELPPGFAFLNQIFPTDQYFLTIKETAAILRRSCQYVRDCCESQKILAFRVNGKAKRGQERRYTYLIPVMSLKLYILECICFDADDFLVRWNDATQHLQQWELT